MSMKIKNIAKSEILVLKEQISYQEGQVVSKTLAQNPKITIDGTEYLLHEGESIVMPAGHPHAVYGQEAFKMLLIVVF